MIQVTSEQWLYWLHLYFWPLLRVLALISTAPILSERAIPKRVKLGLGIMITLVIAPSLPANDTPLFSIAALWLAMQQILIGIALGFTMQFAFAAVRTAGEFIGLQMGLSFATFVDPGSHLNMPVLARIMDMLAMLLFLTFNGHLWLISLLVDTFHTLPIGSNPVNSNAFMALARAGGLIFLNGLMLALPVITLLLTLNLALGLGDGPNDAPLLDVMDYAVVVKGLNREGVHLRNDDPQRVYRSQNEGPDGWREGMDYFFSRS
ncbi:flagellar type III secretion system protein FliR [Salmonella enterica]|nr:flagellar type III secretion system protein FliR [Salmonella enterica]